MVPESHKTRRNKDYTGSFHLHNKEGSPNWVHDKFEAYSHGYEAKHNQSYKHKYRNPAKDLMLNINGKNFVFNNVEHMDRSLFVTKLTDQLNKLKLDEETFLLTKIKIYDELRTYKSKHYDIKEYESILGRYAELNDKLF